MKTTLKNLWFGFMLSLLTYSIAPGQTNPNLCGIWFGYNYSCCTFDSSGNCNIYQVPVEVINIFQDSLGNLQAIKIVGDSCVPAGNVSWQGSFYTDIAGIRINAVFTNGNPDSIACCNGLPEDIVITDSSHLTSWDLIEFYRASCLQVDSMGLNLNSINPACGYCKSASVALVLNPKKNIFVYPNPAVENVTIEVGESLMEKNFALYDIFGKPAVIKMEYVGNGKWNCGIGHLTSGIYTLEINSVNSVRAYKIVKQ